MASLSSLTEADLQILNDPTKSVKRAQIASLCRKASLKVKGTNAELIAALNSVAYRDVNNKENVNSLALLNEKGPFRPNEKEADENQSGSLSENVFGNSKQDVTCSQWIPTTSKGRSKMSLPRGQRAKRRSTATTELYPELSIYPDISEHGTDLPDPTAEGFGKIAEGILEEMNSRVAVKQQSEMPARSSSVEALSTDVAVHLNESPFISNIEHHKTRFSDAHNQLFDRMESVKTHYAAQRDRSESPVSKQATSFIRVPKRPLSAVDRPVPSTKRKRNGINLAEKSRFFQGRREESLSEQGRDIQNLTRQEFRKRLQKELGNLGEGEDSVELESSRMPGKTCLDGNIKFGYGNKSQLSKGNVIPVKPMGWGAVSDDSLTLAISREFSVAIQPPCLSAEKPSIILVPGDEPELPKDKKVPMKHTPKTSQIGSQALIIPAARPTKKAGPARSATMRTAAAPGPSTSSSFKATFTMGSIPKNTTPRHLRKSQRLIKNPLSPNKSLTSKNVSRSTMGKELVRRAVLPYNVDIQVPVKFDGAGGKRKFVERNNASPNKRIKVNAESAFTPIGKLVGRTPPSMALVRHSTANNVKFTPGTVSSRTPVRRTSANRHASQTKPPWRG